MRILVNAKAQWHLLTSVYPLFKESLPHIEDVPKDYGHYPAVQNAISRIRFDVRAIPLQLQRVQLSQYLTKRDFDRFMLALNALLLVFESFIDSDIQDSDAEQGQCGPVCVEEAEMRSQYPKLTAVKSIMNRAMQGDPLGNENGWRKPGAIPTDQLQKLLQKIRYARTMMQFIEVYKQIESFNATIQDVFSDSLEASDDGLGNRYALTKDEIAAIQRAYQFNSSSNSLFMLLANNTTCDVVHNIRVCLSGFQLPELDLLVTGCHGDQWLPTRCRCSPRPPVARSLMHGLCSHLGQAISGQEQVFISFSEGGDDIWEDVDSVAPPSWLTPIESAPSLGELLKTGGLEDLPDDQSAEFEPEDSKIVEAILACALFYLHDSYWVQQGWNLDHILVGVLPESSELPSRWIPQVPCTLEVSSGVGGNAEGEILSFGILMMEMEAKRRVKLSPDDIDYETGTYSKDLVLERILAEWKRKLGKGYLQVGRACLNFRQLAEKIYHPDLTGEQKCLAAIYKHILSPLLSLLTKDYSDASHLFVGLPHSDISPQVQPSTAGQVADTSGLALFDDLDAWTNPHYKSYGKAFLADLDDLAGKIRQLSSVSRQLPTWRNEKVRIAILDTGIDDEDILIETALQNGRIRDTRDFVSGSDVRDSYGHGTHVTRLLLQIAPAAELYIAKISNSKHIHSKNLNRIPEVMCYAIVLKGAALTTSQAIRWAAEEKKVHIISMSFGLESRNVEIDRAIQRAAKADKIMFAAAANDGGRKPRAFPASRSDVICIHASDGNGNDGGISPTCEPKKDNFTTLGIAVESRWKRKDVFKSGTSFATPVAVGMAANVLEFARHMCDLSEYENECLYRLDGILGILRLLAAPRSGYDFLSANNLWDKKNSDDDISSMIMKVVR
ncbi:Fc.00g112980.m01.CDS01 [Cosmosporella sp. VM-42]